MCKWVGKNKEKLNDELFFSNHYVDVIESVVVGLAELIKIKEISEVIKKNNNDNKLSINLFPICMRFIEVLSHKITRSISYWFTFWGIFTIFMSILEERYHAFWLATLLSFSLSMLPMKLYEYLCLRVSRMR